MDFADPSRIDLGLESRAVTFENPTGAKGAAGTAHGGRKGAPNRLFRSGERIVLADLEGPGTLRHFWLTVPPMQPDRIRAIRIEVFYDGLAEPSICVPMPDFFGVPLGRPVPLTTALTTIQEGRGFNSYVPMPFESRVRVEIQNESGADFPLYYQIDYTLEMSREREASFLHVSYRRENPTTMKQDFVIAEGLKGPGRFLGCVTGIRVLQDDLFAWYGEGEVKFYLDGDRALPTLCGTGLEDYVGTAWAMGAHQTPYQGVPFEVRDPQNRRRMPDMTGFYRWHLADPILFREDLKVTIQQIGAVFLPADQEDMQQTIEASNPLAGPGWQGQRGDRIANWGVAERSDDYSAAAFLYCRAPQAVPIYSREDAIADIGRFSYEEPSETERAMTAVAAKVES
jgi:hypothetical protein